MNESDRASEWKVLKYLVGITGALPEDIPDLPAILSRISRLNPFTDDRADLLYMQGVERQGITQAMAAMEDPDLLDTASQLFSRLIALKIFLTPGAFSQVGTTEAAIQVEARMDPDAEIRRYLQKLGYDPRTAAVPLETLVEKLRDKFNGVREAQT